MDLINWDHFGSFMTSMGATRKTNVIKTCTIDRTMESKRTYYITQRYLHSTQYGVG